MRLKREYALSKQITAKEQEGIDALEALFEPKVYLSKIYRNREKNPLKFRGKKSGSRTLIIQCFKENHAQIFNQGIDIFAVKAEENDESKRTAEAFAVFQRSIGASIHHEFFGELGLS